jgi:NDP-sugar pyrophosphorylase family protein
MSKPENITAVVLAGGKGTRLLPHTAELPKPLVPVGEKPIVEYMLRRLKKGGVTRVIMAVNHLAEQIEDALGDGSRFGLDLSYSHEDRPLSTVAPLKLIDNLPDHFIVANGDVLTDLDIGALYRAHVDSGAALTVAVYRRTENIDYGVLEIAPDNRVTSFSEKPDYSFVVSMGVYVFSREVLDLVPDDGPFGFDQLMIALLTKKQKVLAYPYDGYWLDIGRPSDYKKAQEDIERVEELL